MRRRLLTVIVWACCGVGGVGCGIGFSEAPTDTPSGGGAPDSSTGVGDTGTASGAGGGNGGAAGGPGGADSSGSGAAAELQDDDLLVRYYLDEDTSGPAPITLRDAAPDPFDLDIVYTGALRFDGADKQRGLRFDMLEDDARCRRLMDGTKLDSIDGLTRATVEVVVSLLDASSVGTRLLHVGDTGNESRFSLQARSTTELDFEWRGSTEVIGVWVVPDMAARRAVVHFVLDTPDTDPQERGRLYLDGVRQSASIAGTAPGEAVAVGLGRYLVLGNRESGGRTPVGTIHYAAIYTNALPDPIIADHAAVLLANDDTPSR